jgi:hypothetical protein
MKQSRIAELIGRTSSQISHMVGRGALPDYPENYKTITDESEVMEYVEECRAIIYQMCIKNTRGSHETCMCLVW